MAASLVSPIRSRQHGDEIHELAAAMIVLQQQLMQGDGALSQMQTQLNTLRVQRTTGTALDVDTMSEVSSGELNWSGLSGWTVLSDPKQRV